MTTATMEILVGQGFDPRDFTLMSYGGAGGLFAANLAKDMSISRVIIPLAPGVFSARGILTMNLVHTYAAAYVQPMDDLNLEELEGVYSGMENNASKLFMAEGLHGGAIGFERSLDICFEGQRYYVETPVPRKESERDRFLKEVGDTFRRLYEQRYGHLINATLKTMNARLKATGKIKRIPLLEIEKATAIPESAVKKKRQVFLEGNFVEAGIYERAGLLCGNRINGPAIIEEPFHTTVVMTGQSIEVDRIGNLIIRTGGV